MTDYNGRVTTPDRKPFEVHDKAGSVSWRQAGIHLVENIGSQPMEGIIVDGVAARAQGTEPATRRGYREAGDAFVSTGDSERS